LADDEVLFRFYDERLPAGIADGRSFETWYRTARRSDPRLLYMDKGLLLQSDAGADGDELFPEQLAMNGVTFALQYKFAPGEEEDGVTLVAPLMMLNQVDGEQAEWLVPGLLQEKIIALIRSLP
jgi:ATP-dependent helicase HrpA